MAGKRKPLAKRKRGPNKAELRIAELHQAISKRGWDPSMARTFAARWGTNPAEVYKIKRRVLDRMANDDDLDLDLRRALFLAELRDARRTAKAEGRWGPVSQLLKMEAQILGLFAPVEIRIDANPLHAMTDAELEAIVLGETAATKARKGGKVIDADFTVSKVKA
jgi:hypothetical protein